MGRSTYSKAGRKLVRRKAEKYRWAGYALWSDINSIGKVLARQVRSGSMPYAFRMGVRSMLTVC
jgi:hypothetical protein